MSAPAAIHPAFDQVLDDKMLHIPDRPGNNWQDI